MLEDSNSYLGNALLKARALQAQLKDEGVEAAVLADDSGLEVDILGGRPGVFSARYAGNDITWPQRRAVLLGELDGVPEDRRTARFVSVMALVVPSGEPHVAIGSVDGRITTAETGDRGFGYDPVFFYPPFERTFAQLDPKEKNGVSHRKHAADALLASLRRRG